MTLIRLLQRCKTAGSIAISMKDCMLAGELVRSKPKSITAKGRKKDELEKTGTGLLSVG